MNSTATGIFLMTTKRFQSMPTSKAKWKIKRRSKKNHPRQRLKNVPAKKQDRWPNELDLASKKLTIQPKEWNWGIKA